MVSWHEEDDDKELEDSLMGLKIARGSNDIWGGTLNRLHAKIDAYIESIPNAIDVEYDHPEWNAGFAFTAKNLKKYHKSRWTTSVSYTRYTKLPRYNFIDF